MQAKFRQLATPKGIRVVLGGLALGVLTAYQVWALLRFGEVGNAVLGWVMLAVPVILYVLVVRQQLTSTLVGVALIATRIWIFSVLETSTSSTAGLVVIPALFIDAVAIAAGVIADQLVILLEDRRMTRRHSK